MMVLSTHSFSPRAKITSILQSRRIDIPLILLFALALRVVNLQNFPRWYVDEGSMAVQGINMFHLHWGYSTWGPNFFPPFFVMIDGLFLTLLGGSYLVARLPGALMGSISCLLTYIIACRLCNRRIALVAASILAVSGAYVNRMALQDNAVELFFLATVLFYMKFKEHPGIRLEILLGMSAGLAVLSKYTGVVAPLFLLLQGGYERKLSDMKNALLVILLCTLVYPILGLMLDWNGFVFDTLFQATRQFNLGTVLYTISLAGPFNQIESWQSALGLTSFSFTAIGLLSLIYMIVKERDLRTQIAGSVLLSLLVVLIAAGQVWWGSLILLYPFYAIATSYALFQVLSHISFPRKDAASEKITWSLRSLDPALGSTVVLICLLAASLYAAFMPFGYTVGRFDFAIFALVALLAVFAYRAGFRRVLGFLLILLMASTLIGAGIQSTLQMTTNDVGDQMQVVQYLNAHTTQTDIVAANSAITWLLNCYGVNYAEVALYTTHKYTFLYSIELLPRFKMNISLWNVRYIVLDTPWIRDKIGDSLSAQELTPIILSSWRSVADIGDYHVYENPHRNIEVAIYSIQGYVFASDGTTPVSGCWVSLYDPSTNVAYGSWTDGEGHYSFSVVGGIYVFDVAAPMALLTCAKIHQTNFIVSSNVAMNVTLTCGT